MKEQKEKVKLSYYRDVAVLASVIPLYRKAMGFRSDSSITSLAEHAKGQIEYEIGAELAELREKVLARVREINEPFVEEAKALGEGSPELAELNTRLAAAINSDDQIMALSKQEAPLWGKDVAKDIDPAVIDMIDYSERFPDERRTVQLFGRNYEQDGYAALLQLHAMGLITYRNEQ